MKKNISTLTLLTVCAQLATAQSPWTKEKGNAFIQAGLTGLFYNSLTNDNGQKQPLNGSISDVTLQAYTEFGLTSKLTGTTIIPYKTITFENKIKNITQTQSGIGNLSVGLKYKMFDKNIKISAGILFTANSISRNETNFLTTGFNSTTILPYLTIGSSKNKWYYYGNVGYGYMNNNYSDYFRFNGELGYEVIPKGHIIFAVETKNILSKESAFENDVYSNFSNTDRQEYNALGLKLNYEFIKDNFGLNLAAYGAFNNKNAPFAPTLNLG